MNVNDTVIVIESDYGGVWPGEIGIIKEIAACNKPEVHFEGKDLHTYIFEWNQLRKINLNEIKQVTSGGAGPLT